MILILRSFEKKERKAMEERIKEERKKGGAVEGQRNGMKDPGRETEKRSSLGL